MKTEKFESASETAYGKKLDEAIKYDGTYEAFESLAEVRAANEYPSDDDIVTVVNNKRKAAAKSKSLTAALTAAGFVKPTIENDEQLRLKKFYDIMIVNGSTHDEARAIAASTLGLAWE